MASATDFELRQAATVDGDAAALLDAYATEVYERTVVRDPCRIETVSSEYVEPGGSFLVLYDDGRPVGCGGVRDLGEGIGELKRMYVVPGARGRGHGRRLLAALEDEARRLVRQVKLRGGETM